MKLADMFQELVPDLVGQINAAGRIPLSAADPVTTENPNSAKLSKALELYVEAFLVATDKTLTESEQSALAREITTLSNRSGSASDQRSAFAMTNGRLQEITGAKVKSKRAILKPCGCGANRVRTSALSDDELERARADRAADHHVDSC